MPTPVNDAAVALRVNQTKMEHALTKVAQNFLSYFLPVQAGTGHW